MGVRGKRAEQPSANGDAGDDAEAGATPGVGHNQLTDDQKAALTFQHKTAYQTALAAAKEADAALRNVCKLAKSELGDDAVATIKDMIALESEAGEAKLKEQIERMARAARWMGLPFGAQANMFEEDRTPAIDRAAMEGKRDGLAGKTCKPDYDPSTPQYKSYMEHYHQGQAVLAKGFNKTPVEQAAATEQDPPAGMSRDEWQQRLREQNNRVDQQIRQANAVADADEAALTH